MEGEIKSVAGGAVLTGRGMGGTSRKLPCGQGVACGGGLWGGEMEDVVEGLDEGAGVEGFGEEFFEAERLGGGLVHFVGVPGGEQDGEVGVEFPEGLGEFDAAEARHGEVGEDGVELLGDDLLDGLLGVVGDGGLVAEGAQALGDEGAEEFLLVDEENFLTLSGGDGGVGSVGIGGVGGDFGEVEGEGGAGAWSAVYGHGSIPGIDDAAGDPEAESRALVGGFGGEEGFEDAVEVFGGDAAAGVGDAEAEVGFFLELGEAVEVGVGGGCEADLEEDASGFVSDGVPGVEDEVGDDLLELGDFAEDVAVRGLDVFGEFDVGGDGGAKHEEGFSEGEGGADGASGLLLFAAEGEQGADEVGGAVAGGADVFEVALGLGVCGGAAEADFREADDAAEDVVEVVGGAAGEDADGAEALGVAEALFELALVFLIVLNLGAQGLESGVEGAVFSHDASVGFAQVSPLGGGPFGLGLRGVGGEGGGEGFGDQFGVEVSGEEAGGADALGLELVLRGEEDVADEDDTGAFESREGAQGAAEGESVAFGEDDLGEDPVWLEFGGENEGGGGVRAGGEGEVFLEGDDEARGWGGVDEEQLHRRSCAGGGERWA
ncbi:MAG: hypothetical protein RLZZ142_1715 [Verrucomicrobiota bacterium]